MKPTFALDFRDGNVTLLHRTSRGWSLVGSTTFGAPDFEETLAFLRSTAVALSPRGLTTKLILPGDQILYTDVEVPATDASRRKRLIRLGLEGRTPYPVEDLAWDWVGDGPVVRVAVIAKETLATAEAFAVEHRFNPVSFVAVPEAEEFAGEPFFGMTAAAPAHLGTGDVVERDSEPVREILREAPKPEAGPAITEADFAPPVIDARDLPEEEPVEAQTAETPAEDPVPVAPPAETPSDQPAEQPAEIPVETPAERPLDPPAEAPEPPPAEVPDETPDELPPETSAASAPFPAPLADLAPLRTFEPVRKEPVAAVARMPEPVMAQPVMAQPVMAEAPMALDVMADPAVEDDLPPAPAPAIQAALASRRAAEAEAKPEARSPMGGVTRPGAARPVPVKGKSDPIDFPSKAAKAAKQKSAGVTSPTIPGMPRREKTVVQLPVSEGASDGSAAAKPARPAQVIKGRTPIGGKPRYLGLALTVGLLLLLAGVAAWSSLFMGTGDPIVPAGETVTPEATPDVGTDTAPAGTTDPITEPATDPAPAEQEGALTPEPQPTETPEATATAEAAATPEARPAESDPVATSSPQTSVATLSAPATAPASGSGGISLDASDTPPALSSVALNAPTASLAPLSAGIDAQPAASPVPPPFGTVYKFDAEGRIEPTPEGIMSPEGVLLVAGRPDKVPPAKPADLVPAAAATATEAAVAETEALPFADPSLNGKRPSARPADLAPLQAADDQQGLAEEALVNDPELAALRPAARPEGLAPTPVAATPDDVISAPPGAGASLVASGAPLLTAPVARAPRPPVRPTSLDRTVDDAVTAALDPPAAQEPTALDEPEPEDHAPSLPTSASVAKQATDENVLNTRKLALLAVFGTSSNRFAMVRQPNGAVKKVKVGDSLDGGRIAAITANAIQYQKGGRMVTLALPTG